MAGIEFKSGDLIEHRYRVLLVIGKGGMGTLYRVADEAGAGKVLALKMLCAHVSEAQASGMLECFQREFRILMCL